MRKSRTLQCKSFKLDMKIFTSLILIVFLITGCKTVSKKVDDVSNKEVEKLEKFLKKTESELKIEFGNPDIVEISDNKNRILVYYDSKFKIKCERRFEVNSQKIIVAFKSKNCF
tara:strand:- start:3113 stop:3454 length:342 start_codon:yes stop_codon:yes gene_type:complete